MIWSGGDIRIIQNIYYEQTVCIQIEKKLCKYTKIEKEFSNYAKIEKEFDKYTKIVKELCKYTKIKKKNSVNTQK